MHRLYHSLIWAGARNRIAAWWIASLKDGFVVPAWRSNWQAGQGTDGAKSTEPSGLTAIGAGKTEMEGFQIGIKGGLSLPNASHHF